MSPFAWQNNKAILFYLTQNSVQDLIQHWCTEAEFWASNSKAVPQSQSELI